MLLHNKAAKLHVASCAPDALLAASVSFARGADSASFAAALAAAAKQAPASERTLFSARAALLVHHHISVHLHGLTLMLWEHHYEWVSSSEESTAHA